MVIILLAFSLSMDAFSLSIFYGINGVYDKKLRLSIIVGLYHFIMPILGELLGNEIIQNIPISLSMFSSIIFIFIGILMIKDTFENKKMKSIDSIINMLLFGFAVSIDSFFSGIGIKSISKFVIFPSISFMIVSFIMTYIGLTFGDKIGNKIGKFSSLVGGVILILLGIIYLIK